jgi:hypothetical protein
MKRMKRLIVALLLSLPAFAQDHLAEIVELPTEASVEAKVMCTPAKDFLNKYGAYILDKRWLDDNKNPVHCSLEWRELNPSTKKMENRCTFVGTHDPASLGLPVQTRVGEGQVPALPWFSATKYGIYVIPSPCPHQSKNVVEVSFPGIKSAACLKEQVFLYGAKGREFGSREKTRSDRNNGLGGPAYKPAQNCNTMISHVLSACGADASSLLSKLPKGLSAPGWGRKAEFPGSTDADVPARD